MTVIFTTVASAADYGTFGRWLLLVFTVLCWASQYAEISLMSEFTASRVIRPDNPLNSKGQSRWPLAMALFMIGFITYGATLVFYSAIFPRLARNTLHSRTLRARFEAGDISRSDYEVEVSLEKNRISNISTVCPFSIYLPFLLVDRLCVEGTQQHWLYRNSVFELDCLVAFGTRS